MRLLAESPSPIVERARRLRLSLEREETDMDRRDASDATSINDMTDDENAITSLLASYQDSLNSGDLEAAMSAYAPDGIFMPQNSPSSVGIAAIREAYVKVFGELKFDVVFRVEEVHQLAPEWAFARTNSTGTTTHRNGAATNEANQELFVLRKLGGAWKIARYCFSTTNPA